MKECKKYKTLLSIFFSGISLAAFKMNLLKTDYTGSPLKRYLDSMSGATMEWIFLFVGLACMFFLLIQEISVYKPKDWKFFKRDLIYAILPGGGISLCMIIGNAIEANGMLAVLYMGKIQLLKSLTVFVGYFSLFSLVILYLYYLWDNIELCKLKLTDLSVSSKGIIHRYILFFEEHTFLCVFLTIFALYIPYIILSYPSILQGDARDIIAQGFNFPNYQSEKLVLLDEHIYINAHHPVIYTFLVHFFLMAGKKLFGSWNVGLFAISMIQCLFAIMVISNFISFLKKLNVKRKICFLIMLYYVVSPRIVSYMFLLSKEVFYTYIFLSVMTILANMLIFKIKDNSLKQWKKVILLCFLACAIAFFRNEGKYVLYLWLLLLCFKFNNSRKILLCMIVSVFVMTTFVNQIIMPFYKITPGSIREMLSVPFQQTARYVRQYPNEVTIEERKVIDQVLKYDTLSKRYVTDNSDNVKNNWNKYASKKDLKRYFSVWYQMGKKHPLVYAEATINNYYYYLYPGKRLAANYSYEWSKENMDKTNTSIKQVGINLHYPNILNPYRNIYECVRERVFNLPVLNLFKSTAFYIWLFFVFVCYMIRKRNVDFCLVMIFPLILSIGVLFLGPCNGYYFRYAYIITVILPAVLALGLISSRDELLKCMVLHSKRKGINGITMDKIAILIPCYNEEKTIEKVVNDWRKELPEATIYVYDNNSSDQTAVLAKQAGAVVRHEYAQGKGNVIRRMFREIDAECYIMVDGDDTYPAEYGKQMADLVLYKNADMVVGDRLSSTYFNENKRLLKQPGERKHQSFVSYRYSGYYDGV